MKGKGPYLGNIRLNHWISALDDRLEEGIHYTIMFYGGGLIVTAPLIPQFMRLD
jgi:hypothetical protein